MLRARLVPSSSTKVLSSKIDLVGIVLPVKVESKSGECTMSMNPVFVIIGGIVIFAFLRVSFGKQAAWGAVIAAALLYFMFVW